MDRRPTWSAGTEIVSIPGRVALVLVDPFVSTTRHLDGRMVVPVMAPADLLVASTPIILVVFCLACRGVPTLIAWRRERKYQAEWHRTFGTSSRSSSCAADSDTARAGP